MNAVPGLPPTRIDIDDDDGMRYWCDHFGATVQQLMEAVKAVGDDPGAVRDHLLNQGASAGPG
jgi:hypothetical protein